MSQHHDPVHPDSDHLTAEVLADLDLGLLDDASAAHVPPAPPDHLLQMAPAHYAPSETGSALHPLHTQVESSLRATADAVKYPIRVIVSPAAWVVASMA